MKSLLGCGLGDLMKRAYWVILSFGNGVSTYRVDWSVDQSGNHCENAILGVICASSTNLSEWTRLRLGPSQCHLLIFFHFLKKKSIPLSLSHWHVNSFSKCIFEWITIYLKKLLSCLLLHAARIPASLSCTFIWIENMSPSICKSTTIAKKDGKSARKVPLLCALHRLLVCTTTMSSRRVADLSLESTLICYIGRY